MRFRRVIKPLLERLRGEEPTTESDINDLSWTEFHDRTGKAHNEYIVLLLEANDGSMRQTELADQSGMSRAAVTRWLDDMEAEGTIARKQIDRENVVFLHEAAPPTT